MLGHRKRSLYVRVYLATGTENAVNQIMTRNLIMVHHLDLSDICKPDIDNIVEKTYSSVILKRIINHCKV